MLHERFENINLRVDWNAASPKTLQFFFLIQNEDEPLFNILEIFVGGIFPLLIYDDIDQPLRFYTFNHEIPVDQFL